jgi:hypothetical protein
MLQIKSWFAKRSVKMLVILVAAFTSVLFVKCSIVDKAVENSRKADSNEILRKGGVARSSAEIQREVDGWELEKRKASRERTLQGAVDEKPSAASLAISCERLRAQGFDTSDFPQCSGFDTKEKAASDSGRADK